ncbi:hypothetical protein [Amycolatopsis australiensis]|uniref:Uncharacterized protein n=1 Tax=Amycolatopsis australiensis TaxID=546364 RepID=A0A1K1PVA6_9PSEU|nr:hypothetical protein [Amycolatopsis australiensis]SFW51429.1 hypothetical protein SAMN04489730_1059 [Amycolatopsis australiensis]
MFSMILTWVGAVLGLALLIAMAAGTFVVDFDDRLQERRRKAVPTGAGGFATRNPRNLAKPAEPAGPLP